MFPLRPKMWMWGWWCSVTCCQERNVRPLAHGNKKNIYREKKKKRWRPRFGKLYRLTFRSFVCPASHRFWKTKSSVLWRCFVNQFKTYLPFRPLAVTEVPHSLAVQRPFVGVWCERYAHAKLRSVNGGSQWNKGRHGVTAYRYPDLSQTGYDSKVKSFQKDLCLYIYIYIESFHIHSPSITTNIISYIHAESPTKLRKFGHRFPLFFFFFISSLNNIGFLFLIKKR